MTTKDTEAKIAELEAKIAELSRKSTVTKWQSFGTFTAENRMSRTKLNTLISRGIVEVNKCGRAFLYRWA